MEVNTGRKVAVLILGLICAYFLAKTISVALLSAFRLSEPVQAVGGFLLFAVVFLLILKGLEKVFGMVFFTLNLK